MDFVGFCVLAKTGFEASERNEDPSHAPTARKLTLDHLENKIFVNKIRPKVINLKFFEVAKQNSVLPCKMRQKIRIFHRSASKV